MANISPAAKSFLRSALLLVAALVLFLVMLYPRKRVEVPPVKGEATESVTQAKRQSMRHSSDATAESEAVPAASEPPATRPVETAAKPVQAQPAAEITAPSDDPEVQRAINLIDTGRVDEAVTVLEGVLKKDPRNENALVELAMINLLDLKQPDAALGYLQRVMDVNPNNQVVLSELVSLYEEQGKIEEGLSFLQEVQTKNPASPDLAYGIGQLLSLQGRDGEAIAYLEKATQSGENGVRAYRDLAEAYSRAGDSEKAIESYDRAISSQEKDIAEKQARGMPVTFAEERLNYTKMDKARELIRLGDLDSAQKLTDEVGTAMPGDESVMALQESIRRKRG